MGPPTAPRSPFSRRFFGRGGEAPAIPPPSSPIFIPSPVHTPILEQNSPLQNFKNIHYHRTSESKSRLSPLANEFIPENKNLYKSSSSFQPSAVHLPVIENLHGQASSLPSSSDVSPSISSKKRSLLPSFDQQRVHDDRQDKLEGEELLKLFLTESAEEDKQSSLPPPCSCHDAPLGSCKTYQQTYMDIVHKLHKTHSTPNMQSLQIPLPNQVLDVSFFARATQDYFDRDELVNALLYGWDFDFGCTPQPKDAPRNLASAELKPDHVDVYRDAELAHGSILGPFKKGQLPFTVFHSPLGAVEKQPIWRTITDLSQLGLGINGYINPHFHHNLEWRLFLPTTESFVDAIKRNRARFPGKQLLMWKCDFSRYYRWFFLDPGQVQFFAFRWRGLTFLDLAMAFGNRAAALFAQRVSWAIAYILRTKIPPFPGSFNTGCFCKCSTHCRCGEIETEVYIDDLISIAPHFLAHFQFEAFKDFCRKLGLPLSKSEGHVVAPTSKCTALGFIFDLDNNTISLPEKKRTKLLDTLRSWKSKSVVSEKDLASLCGRCLLYTSPSPRDLSTSRMPSSA